jgi:hypothetical protein
MSRLSLKTLAGKIKRSPLTGEDEEHFDYLEKEVLLPCIKWSIIGGFLMIYVTRISPGAIGSIILLLTLYLLFGLMLFLRDRERQLGELRGKLERETILFHIDMIRKKKRDLILGFVLSLSAIALLLVIMVLLYHREAFSEYWSLVSPDMKSDHYALLFSVFISLAVVFTASYKVTEMSNLVITGRGIFISDHFVLWNDIEHSEIEFFFKRPIQLVLHIRDMAAIRIDLYRFRIDNAQAEQIAAILRSCGKM